MGRRDKHSPRFLPLLKSLDHHGTCVFNSKTCLVRTVRPSDLETLRVWKNANRFAFHHQDVITPEQQAQWFDRFANDPAQQLFLCEIEGEPIACVGFRVKDATRVELFNLICGSPIYRGSGLATRFLERMRDVLAGKGYTAIELEVLKSNPEAISWYARRGFQLHGEGGTFLRLLLTRDAASAKAT